MQFSVWYVSGALVCGFILGAAIAVGCNWAAIKHARRSAAFAVFSANMLANACRKMLADSRFRKVMREHERLVDEYMAAAKGGEK